MKKIILLSITALIFTSSFAQVSLAVQAGANLGMGHYEDKAYGNIPGEGLGNEPRVGPLVGLVAEVGFGKLAFRPELNFVQKGGKSTNSQSSFEDKYSLYYFEIPLNVVYKRDVGKVFTLFIGLGPAVALGVGGKIKFSDSYSTETVKIKFDGDKDKNDEKVHFKGVDVSANIIAGFKSRLGIFGKVSYTHGFTDIDPYVHNSNGVPYNISYKNRGLSFCIGYIIAGKK